MTDKSKTGKKQPVAYQDPRLQQIIESYMVMNEQGRDYLWKASDMAKSKYHKETGVLMFRMQQS